MTGLRWVVLFSSLLMLGGCAKFRSRKVVNIGLFADHTVTMLSQVDMGLSRDETLLLRRFLQGDTEEEQRLKVLTLQMERDIQIIVRYSIDMVNIAESGKDEEVMVSLYADYIEGFRKDMKQSSDEAVAYFDSTIAEIREAEDLLGAMRAAQPMLNAAVINAAVDMDEIIAQINVVADMIDRRIDTEFDDIIRYRQKLEDEKFQILRGFEIIYDAYSSEEPDISALKEGSIIWMPDLIPDGRPTRAELQGIVKHLETRLEALHTVQNEIAPDWQEYVDTHAELNRIVQQAINRVSQMRIIMLAWVRAHQNMAAGKLDPADWFDVGEMTKGLIRNSPNLL